MSLIDIEPKLQEVSTRCVPHWQRHRSKESGDERWLEWGWLLLSLSMSKIITPYGVLVTTFGPLIVLALAYLRTSTSRLLILITCKSASVVLMPRYYSAYKADMSIKSGPRLPSTFQFLLPKSYIRDSRVLKSNNKGLQWDGKTSISRDGRRPTQSANSTARSRSPGEGAR